MNSLLVKLHKIMESVDYIQKDKRNAHQNYTYASEKAIKEALHAAFVENKVMMFVSTKNPQMVGSAFCIEVNYSFRDIESADELSGSFVGSGQGRDEKGNYAAVTGAIKYILTSTFLIPTGDDPENDEPKKPVSAKIAPTQKPVVPPPEKATPEQLTRISQLCKELGGDGAEEKLWQQYKTTPATVGMMMANTILTTLNAKKANLNRELDTISSKQSA